MKENTMVKVHVYDTSNREIKTRNFDKVFMVYRKSGKLGIDWDTKIKPSCKDDIFTPICAFASSVIFEDVETGAKYHFDNIRNAVVRIA